MAKKKAIAPANQLQRQDSGTARRTGSKEKELPKIGGRVQAVKINQQQQPLQQTSD